MTDPPPSPGTAKSPGRVTEAIDSNGCKTFTVTCDAMGTNYVMIGANQKFIPLSQYGAGTKTARLFCEDDNTIEGVDWSGNSVNVTSVYCSYAVPSGK
uniref:C6 domain-containing protein n=1 Tax=Panagrolaimus davidi TaxID=227884 RepID=A0A914QSR6_9BILA